MDFKAIAQSFEKEQERFRESLLRCRVVKNGEYPRLRMKSSVREQLQKKVETRGFGEPKLLPFKKNNHMYNTLKTSNSSMTQTKTQPTLELELIHP